MPLISIQQVSKVYQKRAVLDNLSYQINDGDKVALIGNNGAGKTTLFRIIEGKIEPDEGNVIHHAGVFTGFLAQNLEDQAFLDSPIRNPEIEKMENEIKCLSDEMSQTSDPEKTKILLRQYQDANTRYETAGGYDYDHRIKEALAGLGLSSTDVSRPISSFSGGERMRVALAKLVVQRPNVLLLDEPTNHLDTEALSWLEDFLQKYGGAVLFISHDRYFIDAVATKVIELDGGKLTMYRGNYSDYYRQKTEFIRNQQKLVAQLEQEVNRQAEVTQTMLSHRKMSSYHSREKVTEKLSDRLAKEKEKLSGGPMRMNFSFVPDKEIGNKDQILLQAKDVSMTFQSLLFKDVSFEQKATEKIFLVGPNGCGKTTLLSLLLGKVPDFQGTILVRSQLRIGYMGQFVPFEDENREMLEELFARLDLSETQCRNLLARFGFRNQDVFKQIKILSGGERSRLYLCCLLQEKPDMLFLDEPTNHLDISSREILEDALKDYPGAILAVSHDRFFIEKCSEKILGFWNQQVFPFYSLSEYQTFLQKKREMITIIVEAEKREKTANTKNLNRALERKNTAKKRERIRILEKEIPEMENMQKLLEESFGKDTTPEDYTQYTENQEKLTAMYDEYLLISE